MQVIDDQRRVLDVSVGADMLVPMLTPAELTRALRGDVVVLPGDQADVDGELRVIARRANEADPDNDNDGGPRVIIVAASTHAVEESTETVRNALLIAYPLLLAALTALAWRVVGATLRPVEVLRAGADQISGGGVVGVAAGADRATTRCTGSRSRSTTCSTGSTRPGDGSGRSWRTRRTNCGPRSRACAPSSRSPVASTSRRRSPTCSRTSPGSGCSSTTCCCWPGSTRAIPGC